MSNFKIGEFVLVACGMQAGQVNPWGDKAGLP